MCNDCPFCFAYEDKNTCKALSKMPEDRYDKCSFYKTPEQAQEDSRKAFVRLLRLPRKQRKKLYKKYYNKTLEDENDG